MRARLAACAILLAGVAAAAPPATYRNPILFADYSDPDVIRVGRDYYLIASSFHFSPGIPVLHSRDLVHWRIIGHVLPRLPFAPGYDMPGPHTLTDAISKPIGGTKYASGVWAPSIRHHAGLFYVYFPTPDEGVFVSTAKNAAGPWSKPVQLIAEKGLEDPAPFWDDDGSAWLIHGKVGAGPLVLRRMSPDGLKILDAGRVIVEDKVNLPTLEGPKLYKRDGWYYIFAPIGGVSTGPQAVLRSRRIDGPYEHRVVLEKGDTAVQGPHQGGYVETPSGEGWFVHFNSTGAFGRIDYLEPVVWKDGWPVIGEPIPGKASGQPVAEYRMPDVGGRVAPVAMQASDEFAGRRLGLQWAWNHNPDDGRWSLTQRPGWMRLVGGRAEHLVTARNTLTQMLQGPAMTATTRVDVGAMRDGQRGGLAMFGVRPSWIGVVREGGVSRVTLASEGRETPGPVLAAPIVQLRVRVGPEQTARYAYSLDDGRSFRDFGDAIPLAQFSWWKGSRPSLFTFTRGSAEGRIDADWFRVKVGTDAP